MKKVITCVGGLIVSVVFASSLFAGAVDNKTNWSAEYIRTLNRNAATDYADIAMYNPAGTVKLEEGFTINGSIQYLSKDYDNYVDSSIIPGTSYDGDSDEPSYLPGIFGVYNRDKWSLFASFSNVGGGGEVDFSKGNKTTYDIGAYMGAYYNAALGQIFFADVSESSLEGESFYLAYSLGGAFSFNDMVSVSLGAKYVDSSTKAKGSITIIPVHSGMHTLTATVKFDQDADGWGGIIGLNLAPNDVLNIGLRYETEIDLDFKANVLEGTNERGEEVVLPAIGIIDGESVPRDLPAVLGLGLSYKFSDKLRLETNLTYYFNEDADWDGAEDDVDNGYDLGIALEYRFTDKLLGSIGYLHTELGMDPGDEMTPENPELDANTIGAGIAYAFNEKFHTNFSIGNAFYEDESFVSELTGAKIEYEKNVFFLAMGLEYRFM